MKNKVISKLLALILLSPFSIMAGPEELQQIKEVLAKLFDRRIELEGGDVRKAYENVAEPIDDEQFKNLGQQLDDMRMDPEDAEEFGLSVHILWTERGLKFKNTEIAKAIGLIGENDEEDRLLISQIRVLIRNGDKNLLDAFEIEPNKQGTLLGSLQEKLNSLEEKRNTPEFKDSDFQYFSQAKQTLLEEIGNRSPSRMVWRALGGAVVIGGLFWLGSTLYKKYQEWKVKKKSNNNKATTTRKVAI